CHRPRTLKLLRRFLGDTVSACNATEATFWVIGNDNKRIEAAVNFGKDCDKVEKVVVHANDSVVGLSATSGISSCIGPDDYMNPVGDQFGVETMVVAPVNIHGQ